MMKFSLYTVIDITYTGQYRNEQDKKLERNQQQNFDTVIQTIELRSNITYDRKPIIINDSPVKYGLNFKSEHAIWYFEWETEQIDVYLKDNSHIGQLIEDFQFVPFIANLNETVILDKPIFKTTGENPNIIFQINNK